MANEAGSTNVPIALKSIKDLIDVTIDQLNRATRTDDVAAALRALDAARKSVAEIPCPSMFFTVKFK
jgi:hypothetical protein